MSMRATFLKKKLTSFDSPIKSYGVRKSQGAEKNFLGTLRLADAVSFDRTIETRQFFFKNVARMLIYKMASNPKAKKIFS